MEIRVGRSTDFEHLAELRWLLKTEDHPETPDAKRAFCRAYCQQLQSSETLGDTVHFVVDHERALLGALTIRIVRKELSPGRDANAWGYLTNVYVREDWRNQSVGSKLLRYAIHWCEKHPLELLIVWPSDRSYSFYTRLGFAGESDPLERVL